MKDVIPYLFFDGNCRDAMTFYEKCFGAELQITPYSSAPTETAPEHKNHVMHARLTKGRVFLMASDAIMGEPVRPGESFSVSVDCESLEETERLFAAVGENGSVTMPLQDTFWGARFGMLKDQFGIHWMFNCEIPKPA